MSLRHSVDITPWNKDGNSWMGLKRGQAKFLASAILIVGLALADPPFSILPTDFLNIWLAGIISNSLNISINWALLWTYTVVAWSLILLGIWIYPYNSQKLLSSNINKLKELIKKIIKKPIWIIVSLMIFLIIFNWYKKILL